MSRVLNRKTLAAFVLAIVFLSPLAWWRLNVNAEEKGDCLLSPSDAASRLPVYRDSDFYGLNTGPGEIATMDTSWRAGAEDLEGDFSFEARVKVLETSVSNGTAGIQLFWKGSNEKFNFGIFPNEGRWKLYEATGTSFVENRYQASGFELATWYTMRIEARGGLLHLFIDGVEKTGPEGIPMMEGPVTVGLRVRNSSALFDNVIIRDGSGDVVIGDDFSDGNQGWKTENGLDWSTAKDGDNDVYYGSTLLGLERLKSPEFSPALAPHYQMMEAAGAKHLRIFFAWNDIQPQSRDHFYWDYMDTQVINAHDHGLFILANIVSSPSWAVAPEHRSDDAYYAYPPQDLSEYSHFVEELVNRYRPGGVLAQEMGWADGYGVTDYQVGHEYNAGRIAVDGKTLFAAWLCSLGQYVDLLQAGHDSVKKLCPDCLVTNGAATELTPIGYKTQTDPSGERQFLWQGVEDLYREIQSRHPGDPDAPGYYFDVLSLNIYEWYVYSRYGQFPDVYRQYEFPDARWYQDRVRNVIDVMNRYGDSGRKIWVTEAAFASADNGDPYRGHLDEAGQVEALDMVYRELAKFSQIERVYWWYSYDTDTFTGLIRDDMTGKPSYLKYAEMSGSVNQTADLDSCTQPTRTFTDDQPAEVVVTNTAEETASIMVFANGLLLASNSIAPGGEWSFQSWGGGGEVTLISAGGQDFNINR
jgi:hypothetical protein